MACFIIFLPGCGRRKPKKSPVIEETFDSRALPEIWQPIGEAGTDVKISKGVLEISGTIEGQKSEASNTVFLSRPLMTDADVFEVSARIAFSGEPARRLSEQEEHERYGRGGEKQQIETLPAEVGPAIRPPAAYFGIADQAAGRSIRFRVEPHEVYLMSSVEADYAEGRGTAFKKIADVTEGDWHTYRIVHDGREGLCALFVDGKQVHSAPVLTTAMPNISTFFGVTGEEGAGVKTVRSARFDDLRVEKIEP